MLSSQNAGKYAEKKVMDLGAGMGMVGITLAKLIGCKVTMTDYIPEVLTLCKENIDMNDFKADSKPACLHLDWNNYQDCSIVKKGEKFDVIIGCELVYAVTRSQNLVKLIQEILAPGGTLVMIIPTTRENREEFLGLMRQLGEFEIFESELVGESYRRSPLARSTEEEPTPDVFYPLKSVDFRYLEIKFNK